MSFTALLWVAFSPLVLPAESDPEFRRLAADYIDRMPALSPIGATMMGDHRFDGKLDRIDAEGRAQRLAFIEEFLRRLEAIDTARLSRELQIDAALLRHDLKRSRWHLEVFQDWAWNPLIYTGKAGGAIYGLTARKFAPLPERLNNAASRLEQIPVFLEQVRKVLQPRRTPRVHAETAVKQNSGVLSIIDNIIVPAMDVLSPSDRLQLDQAIKMARDAVVSHGEWLETELLPQAKGEFRIGKKLFDEKLAFALFTPLSRDEVKRRAESEFRKTREEMYDISVRLYRKQYPLTVFPDNPGEAYRQAVIRAALEIVYQDRPQRGEIPELARRQVDEATEFVQKEDLMTVPDDPLEIILMPKFRRGVSVAYCDSPGPLDRGLKTFYAVSPIPEDWTETQVDSFLREYNVWSMHDLTMHEAVPGHFLQLAHSNRYPSLLRALLSSGTFIEGWAVYSERMMVDAGYLGGDDRMRLINLKWYLRGITNALMDQAIHVDGMNREEAMRLMVEGGFQEEREAAGKWTRAQLTSAQLSTYFVGTQEHWDLRRQVEEAWQEDFDLKRYHDKVMSFGSPPVQFVKALMLDLPIPR